MRLVLVLVAACGHDAGNDDAVGDAGGDGKVMMSDAHKASDAPAAAGLRVFVTSLRYSADIRSAGGQVTALASADSICQTLADASGLGGTFRAWLSTSSAHAIEHITGTGPWYRMDGALAFPNHASLGTTPMVPISIDEKLGTPDPFYESWTGTAVGGYLAPKGARQSVTCSDWTSTIDSTQIGGVLGIYNAAEGTTAEWTEYATGYCYAISPSPLLLRAMTTRATARLRGGSRSVRARRRDRCSRTARGAMSRASR